MKLFNDFIQEKLKINSKSKVNIRNKENWSIKNAEDGDIVLDNWGRLFFIYKCLNTNYKYCDESNENAIVYHAIYFKKRNEIKVATDIGVGVNNDELRYKLATDEQCEEFYKALKDHGYKWDDIKKEVVKL